MVRGCYEAAPFPDNLRKAKNFEVELQRITDWIKLNLDFLSEDLTKVNFKQILCAGCGTGEEALALTRIFPKAKIDAIDISSESLKIAKGNISKAKAENITLAKLSIINNLPTLKKKYDFIYSAGVIHHLIDPNKGFKILAKKLGRKGKMVIMLYNSYGLFSYKCELLLLDLLSLGNFRKRLGLVKRLGLSKGKNKVLVYDSYLNPQVKTFSIETVASWSKKTNLKITSVVPPLYFSGLIDYGLAGGEYIFRRKKILAFILSILEKFSGNRPRVIQDREMKLPIFRTLFFQLIFLLLGKGECQYLLEAR